MSLRWYAFLCGFGSDVLFQNSSKARNDGFLLAPFWKRQTVYIVSVIVYRHHQIGLHNRASRSTTSNFERQYFRICSWTWEVILLSVRLTWLRDHSCMAKDWKYKIAGIGSTKSRRREGTAWEDMSTSLRPGLRFYLFIHSFIWSTYQKEK